MLDPRHVEPSSRRSDYRQAVAYLYDRIDYERTAGSRNDHLFRLERTEELFQQLGLGGYLHRRPPRVGDRGDHQRSDRQRDRGPKVPLIHLAGTKGKGSTATMVSQILTSAGYRVGLYTSPHLTDLEERFRIDGVPCSHQDLIELVQRVAPVVDPLDASGNPVSFFELTTAMAVLHFDRNDCDAIVLEVGLGGRLDSTNVCASTVAAITSIGLDHQRILGDSIGEIATEKAGIIKGGVPVVSGAVQPEAKQAIRRAARRGGSVLFEKGAAFDVRIDHELAVGSEFIYHAPAAELASRELASRDQAAAESVEGLPLFLALDGAHQVHNAAIAVSIVRLLNSPHVAQRLPVSDQQIAAGLQRVRCTGRLERFRWQPDSPLDTAAIEVVLDTAHNHDSIQALCQSISRRVIESPHDSSGSNPPGQFSRPLVVIFATSRDKDVSLMAAELGKIADEIICTRYTTNPRSVSPDQLVDAFAPRGDRLESERDPNVKIRCVGDPQEAFDAGIAAAAGGGTLIICGSFFLAGELRPRLLTLPNLRPSDNRRASDDRHASDNRCASDNCCAAADPTDQAS
ncbi:bifunctional folylpolyglutamate synthase/dihydrofolate synthase [Stieleria neptunia]|uniref:bifunctional folylpolyglutamate synthase/dihydrofolate synthase n=1 Tax=Stieleria neptunia TaxID=2527979 RepID=UPI0018D21BDD|nr:folylpolyglutamate synthase/dihydrofolate synthase family protein [Stieleria neptunia]